MAEAQKERPVRRRKHSTTCNSHVVSFRSFFSRRGRNNDRFESAGTGRSHLAVWGLVIALAGVAVLGKATSFAISAEPNVNVQTGATLSIQCVACHGENGKSVATNIPDIAGQHYEYLLNQLAAFKSGARNSPIMNEMARPLSQQNMRDIAAYFASERTRVTATKENR